VLVAEHQKNGVVGGSSRDVVIAAATDCIAHASEAGDMKGGKKYEKNFL